MARTRVGMIGLGMMGGPMAGHLLRHKFPVFGHDLDPARCRELARRGGTVCPGAASVARQAKVVIVMVGYDHEVVQVCTGPAGLMENMARGSTLVICSTMKLETIRRLERAALRKGLYLIDAPVCRAEEGAIAGNLLMLGSGDRRAFERLRPVLRTFCTDIFHLGKVGAGQVAKICNNILLWISVVANCETFGLAERCGLDKQALVEALRLSTGTNGTIHRWEKMTMPWWHKDLAIALEFAESLKMGLPMAGLTKQLFKIYKLPKARAK
jgi:3-hydroxyisobutyrate dehydrogenase-like beta-hydroxyacid dehydrogenase